MQTYTIPEVAEILKVATRTVEKWAREGRIEASIIGGKKNVRIKKEAVEKFLEDTRIKPA